MRRRTSIIAMASALSIAACLAGLDPPSFDGSDTLPDGSQEASIGLDGSDGDATTDGGGDGNAPDGGVDACTGKDTTQDPRHCGSCFHDCLLGGCTQSRCQPWTVTTSVGTVAGLDVDDSTDRVYFGVGNDVWRVRIDGGAPEKMTTPSLPAAPNGITRSGLGFLACTGSGIYQIPPNAGAPTNLFPTVSSCVGIVADGTTIWASSVNTIYEVKAGGQIGQHPTPPFPNQPSSIEIDVNAQYLFYGSDNNGVRRVSKTAVDAGSTRVGPTGLDRPRGMAVADEYLYITSIMPRQLSRIALDGGALTSIVDLDGGSIPHGTARSSKTGAIYFSVGSTVRGVVPPP